MRAEVHRINPDGTKTKLKAEWEDNAPHFTFDGDSQTPEFLADAMRASRSKIEEAFLKGMGDVIKNKNDPTA